MGCSLPGSSVHGISQARILEWVAISFSKGSSTLGLNPCLLHWQVDSLLLSYQGSPCISLLKGFLCVLGWDLLKAEVQGIRNFSPPPATPVQRCRKLAYKYPSHWVECFRDTGVPASFPRIWWWTLRNSMVISRILPRDQAPVVYSVSLLDDASVIRGLSYPISLPHSHRCFLASYMESTTYMQILV